MTSERTGIIVLLGVAVLGMIYYANSQTPDNPVVPEVQGEMQFLGVNVNGKLAYNTETALDMHAALATHFWAPGYNPRDGHDTSNCVYTPHRYPMVPGGNVSSVVHKGWGSFLQSSPDNAWFYNPPEAAVL